MDAVQIERLRLSLIQHSVNFMAEISDSSLVEFMKIERRGIKHICDATDFELESMDIIRGGSDARQDAKNAELAALRSERDTLRGQVATLRTACSKLVELDETDETYWPPSLREPVRMSRAALAATEPKP